MKILAVILKSLSEQRRQIWILLLTLFMAPFFVAVYFLMWETTSIDLKVDIVNNDQGYEQNNYGQLIEDFIASHDADTLPVEFKLCESREEAVSRIKNKKTSAILILPENFSREVIGLLEGENTRIPFELSGDMSDFNYMLAATWTYEVISGLISEYAGVESYLDFTESAIGISGNTDEFDLYVPGLLILSIVMLMFTASIAFVREPEQRTMLRLKLSKIRNWELIAGISIVQIIIGFLAIILALLVARMFGFEFNGSWGLFLLIATMTSISIIGFSLIVAAFTKTVNQVLVVGNFPLFLFMFFTGAMMPVHGPTLFSFASYDFTVAGFLSPYHAVRALKKVSLFEAGITDIWPELLCLAGITILYFIIGSWWYKRRHLSLL